ncbi:MAG: hypothetical protein ACP5SF_02915 [Thermoplasmata archaeon]
MISFEYILEFFKNNSGALILLIALSVIVSIEIIVYMQSMRYVLLGILASGLTFLGLGIIFYGYTTSYLYSIIILIVVIALLLLGTFVILFIIFLIYLFDSLMILQIYFSASLYNAWTWTISVAVAIIMYFLIKSAEKTLNKKLFTLDSEIRKKKREDSDVRN